MSESLHSVKIDWKMPIPPVVPTRWVSVRPGPSSSGSQMMGKALGIGPEGLDCLDAAFKLGLNRFVGWDIDKLEHAAAARIFKRGVHWRVGDQQCEATQQSGSYSVHLVATEDDLKTHLQSYNEWAFLFDEAVAKHWRHLAEDYVGTDIPTSELTKTLMTVAGILEEIEDAPGVVSVGGGVLGDMAAFAAALAKKPIVFVPTTLLAMADACIGGKTGVNYPPFGKNQIGSFYFPTEVIVWEGWLRTLGKRELNAGIAECLKHMFLCGDMVAAEQIARRNLSEYLYKIIKVKADIVAQDPAEVGIRATLNLGHTLGHALEAHSHKHAADRKFILHGEAVAVGMAFAILLSQDQGLLSLEDTRRMGQILLDAKILPRASDLAKMLGDELHSGALWEQMLSLIAQDKKAGDDANTSNWILLEGPGRIAKGPQGNYLSPVAHDRLRLTWEQVTQTL